MGWGEAVRQTRILRADPGSMIAAAIEDWEYPFPRDIAAAADLYDLQYAKTGVKNPKPYPRPWKQGGDVKKFGNTGGRTRAQVVEILNGMGHTLPV